jgi:hypothetical protein
MPSLKELVSKGFKDIAAKENVGGSILTPPLSEKQRKKMQKYFDGEPQTEEERKESQKFFRNMPAVPDEKMQRFFEGKPQTEEERKESQKFFRNMPAVPSEKMKKFFEAQLQKSQGSQEKTETDHFKEMEKRKKGDVGYYPSKPPASHYGDLPKQEKIDRKAREEAYEKFVKKYPLDKKNKGGLLDRQGYAEGGLEEEMSDVDKFIQLNAELEAAKIQYKGNPEALKNVARHRADIENSFSPETLAEAYQKMDAETEKRDGNMKGGMMKYAEGSMLVPPEMGMEEEMPVDTYDNIPENEMAEAEASQLPDAEMESDYLEFVLGEALETEEQEYLMSVLETDERLGSIFDKVMDVAGEFSGEGSVEGPGTGVSDSIPARLSDGEFVFTKKATDQMGADQLQTMMDEAEKAYDGGLMKKAFGGLTSEDDIEMDSYDSEEEVKKQMIAANQMPSIR